MARIPISYELLKQVLCFPQNVHITKIVHGDGDNKILRPDFCTAIVESPDHEQLPFVEFGQIIPVMNAVSHRTEAATTVEFTP